MLLLLGKKQIPYFPLSWLVPSPSHPVMQQGRELVLLKYINLLLPWGYLEFSVCSPQGCKDVWWCSAKPSMVKRRLEEFQVGCFCSRAHFQVSNCHQRFLLRDAFPIPNLKGKQKATVFDQCQTTSLVCSAA